MADPLLQPILHVLYNEQIKESKIIAYSIKDAIEMALEGEKIGLFKALKISFSDGSSAWMKKN